MDPCQVEMDDKLYLISSGALVPFTQNQIQYQMSGTELSGTAARKAFICNRLRKKEQFFEPMKNLN